MTFQKRDTKKDVKKASLDVIGKKIVPVTWLGILAFGALWLYIYHLSIGYSPELVLSDTLSFFAGASFVGIGFVAVVCLYISMPGIFMYFSHQPEKERKNATSDERLGETRNLSSVFDSEKLTAKRTQKFTIHEQVLLFFLPIFMCLALPFADWIIFSVRHYWQQIVLSIVVLCSMIACLAQSLESRIKIASIFIFLFALIRKMTMPLFWWSIFSLLSAIFVFFIVNPSDKNELLLVFLEFAVAVYFLNFLVCVSVNQSVRLVAICIIAILVVFVIPFVAGNGMLFEKFTVRALGVGDLNSGNLTLNIRQCNALSVVGVRCPERLDDGGQISLQNVNILSKLGSTYLIEVLAEDKRAEEVECAEKLPTKSDTPDSGKPLHGQLLLDRCSDLGARFDVSNSGTSEHPSCDHLSWERAKLDARIPHKTPKERSDAIKKYKASLICYRVFIPKDSVVNYSIVDRRAYSGFTTFSIHVPKK